MLGAPSIHYYNYLVHTHMHARMHTHTHTHTHKWEQTVSVRIQDQNAQNVKMNTCFNRAVEKWTRFLGNSFFCKQQTDR